MPTSQPSCADSNTANVLAGPTAPTSADSSPRDPARRASTSSRARGAVDGRGSQDWLQTKRKVRTGIGENRILDGALITRIRGEYLEMPGLRLTRAEAARFWQVDQSTCDLILRALVDEGCLRCTPDRSFIAAATAGEARNESITISQQRVAS
jgi:hypothetical protein